MYILFLSLFLPECFRNIYFTSLKETTMSINKLLVTITSLFVPAGKVFARGTRSRTSGLGRVWRRRCENRRSLDKFFAMLENQACGPVREKKNRYFRPNTAKNPTGILPACCNLSANFSISSSCHKSVKIRLVTTCCLQTCYNLLKQLAANLLITSFDNQPATSLLTTCKRRTVNKMSQAIRTHTNISLLITSPLQDVNRLVAS